MSNDKNKVRAATKLRHAVSAKRKLLASQLKSRPSFQSIMGAMLTRRSKQLMNKTYPNCWDVPGGHVEGNETPEAALRRELREELGKAMVYL